MSDNSIPEIAEDATVLEVFDIDGDGVVESALVDVDADEDGEVDTVFVDEDVDGVHDVAFVDENQDGEVDAVYTHDITTDEWTEVDPSTVETPDTSAL